MAAAFNVYGNPVLKEAIDGIHGVSSPRGVLQYPFTWERGRGTGEWVEERLDKVVAVEEWCDMYRGAILYNVVTLNSDRSILFLDFHGRTEEGGRRMSFRFENAWLFEEDCRGVVQGAWAESTGLGLQERLGLCGTSLGRWGGERFHKFGRTIGKLHNEMDR
ncbi:PREDICTED: uncharacterized protein LOC109173087 [Ipomoea nil]|uniref:uncharacterized protein LOC109173087 n=1 Tax=Ipomoea nil TaxID=35883 RepID=UPI000901535B|nr:PREDICTED: uncharacterized protein LOC109173087 [Ipomoea nil]